MSDVLDRLKAALADRYGVERELGRGGMATVYLADDVRHRRKVAVKVLHPELAPAIGTDRFLLEIQIVANLTHPHILPLYDSGEADGFLYYVMPYVEGETLRNRLNRERQLPIDDAKKITREVADALSYAHEHDVLHRDIKPENILIQSGHAVVSDFGIAKAIAEAGGDTLTQTGVVVGTPVYMSPEQASGDREIDERSEIYSVTCVLYEMLAGEPPFAGRTAQAIIAHHMITTPPPLKLLRPTVPSNLLGLIEKGLAKAPADRFTSAIDLLAALDSPTEAMPHAGLVPNADGEAISRPEHSEQAGPSVMEWARAGWTLLRKRHYLELSAAWVAIVVLAMLWILKVIEYFGR